VICVKIAIKDNKNKRYVFPPPSPRLLDRPKTPACLGLRIWACLISHSTAHIGNDLIDHTDLKALAAEKKSTSNETISTFKPTHRWTKIHWETNVLTRAFFLIDRFVVFKCSIGGKMRTKMAVLKLQIVWISSEMPPIYSKST